MSKKIQVLGEFGSGKSAYEIALENGFEGTETEWLESLKGKEGYSPVKGKDYYTEEDKSEIKSEIAAEIIVQETGANTTAVMSQAAVTNAISDVVRTSDIVNTIASTDESAPLSAAMGRYIVDVVIPAANDKRVSVAAVQSFSENEMSRARANINAFENVTEPWVFELEDGTTVLKAVGIANMKTFTVNGTTYYSPSNIKTWGEWVDSSYNTGGFVNNTNTGAVTLDGKAVQLGSTAVAQSDVIVNSGVYTIDSGGANEPE